MKKRKNLKKRKSVFKKAKEYLDYYTKYKQATEALEEERNKNAKLLMEISNLEFLLDKDFQAKKIKDQEITIQHLLQVKHELRQEVIDLKSKK